jgi:lysophospholipase L1-like esterase
LGAVNTGVAGDRTSTVIDRITNQGIIDNLHAYLAVLKIGTNDLSGGVDEATVVANTGTILNLIREKNPGCKILLLGILPRGGESISQGIRNVNSAISAYADDSSVFFLDMEAQFSTGLGQVIPELYWDDQLHLSKQGYVVWAQTMNPLFDSILNAPFAGKAGKDQILKYDCLCSLIFPMFNMCMYVSF